MKAKGKHVRSPETIARLRESLLIAMNKPEVKERLREANLGKTRSPEQVAKMRLANLGKKHTAEARANMSAAQKGRVFTPEWKEKISVAKTGHSVSPETRVLIGNANRGRPITPEHRDRLIGNRFVQDASIKGECAYCLGPATTYDHVIPRGRPGWDDPENIVVACRSCNSSKARRTPEEWFGAMSGGA